MAKCTAVRLWPIVLAGVAMVCRPCFGVSDDAGTFNDAGIGIDAGQNSVSMVNHDAGAAADAAIGFERERPRPRRAEIRWMETEDGVLVLTNRLPTNTPRPVLPPTVEGDHRAIVELTRRPIAPLQTPVPPARQRSSSVSFTWEAAGGLFGLGLLLWSGIRLWKCRFR